MDLSLAAPVARADRRPLVVAALRDAPLSVDECLAAVALPEAGGTALFIGTVRDHDGGKSVVELEYSAHPSAEQTMAAVAREVADGLVPETAAWAGSPAQPHRHEGAHAHGAAPLGLLAVAVHHRTGLLTIGDIAVVAAASAAHRAEAFVACRQLIDQIKTRVPIWKRQMFADGTSEWVGAC
ncbi:molybdenum cofactor biosynthesis protein MoaE [Pseudofrankia inefficax]|uniref:Molybdopterin biosynthesis MoaE protein n=1 Tax=Pseudofrankia inefficax (strain DSM 45817 / CECT 9037 / DDB 130130 / EuI1c) TaxID=298654 RepID=E3IUX1_PSEI1|nr:molybdenum cofactor biosynthesis protein MoaE [Pseudofrankia inefficax]ADP78851.1 molybdopterin biosynthesis MoaE protein [Pseudofrankia inefficax]